MLAIESILALYHTSMVIHAQGLAGLYQSIGNIQICHSRELNRGIFLAGALHANSTSSNYNIATLNIQINTTTGTYPQEGVCTAFYQLLHSNGRRWTANTGGGYANLFPIQITSVGNILSVISNQLGIIKMCCNLGTALRISRQNN